MLLCLKGFSPPDPGCTLPLGIEANKIPDTAFSATSMKDSTYPPKLARLNLIPKNNLKGGWCVVNNNPNEYLTIDLGKAIKVTRIATQGLYESDWWTRTYTVSYSQHIDGYFTPYKNDKVKKA